MFRHESCDGVVDLLLIGILFFARSRVRTVDLPPCNAGGVRAKRGAIGVDLPSLAS